MRQCRNINVDFTQDVLNINWERFELIPYVEDAWNFSYTDFMNIVDLHAPWKTWKIRIKGHHLPWINPELIHLFKTRGRAWAKYRSTRDPIDWESYRSPRNLSKNKTKLAKSNYYKVCLYQGFQNPRQFWKHINNILNRSQKVSINSIKIDNEIVNDTPIISNLLNKHFSTIGSTSFVDFSHSHKY